MTKKRKILIARIIHLTGTAISLFFVPWLLVKAWILPMPNTLQEQLDEAVSHGFEGVLLYVDQAGEPPQYAYESYARYFRFSKLSTILGGSLKLRFGVVV